MTRVAYHYEFVELVRDHRLVMRTTQGPFPMETTYSWSPTPDGGTHMTLRTGANRRGSPASLDR